MEDTMEDNNEINQNDQNEQNNQNTQLQPTNRPEISKWWILLSAILSLSLGFYFLRQPASAIITTIFYIAFAKIFSGISGLGLAFKKDLVTRKWNLAISIIDLLFGIFLISSTYLFATFTIMLPFILAAWAFTRGILVIVTSFKSKGINDKWWLGLISGIITLIAAIIIFQNPFLSLLEIMQITGIFMIVMGFAAGIQFIALLFTKKN